MASYSDIVNIINQYPNFRDRVFSNGFLISDNRLCIQNVEVLQNWKYQEVGKYTIITHPDCHSFFSQICRNVFFFFGNAVNPFSNSTDEKEILLSLAEAYGKGEQVYCDKINELTGIFFTGVFKDDTLVFATDAVAMQTVYCGVVEGQCFVSSHVNLIACFAQLSQSDYVRSLLDYKHYHFFGRELPGDLSAYNEISRVQCNQLYQVIDSKITYQRSFPIRPLPSCSTDVEYSKCIADISEILEKTMACVAEKWGKNAWLGLTGGRDSTTSLASAHNFFDSLECFSYITREGERYDAEAAAKIASAVGVKHKTLVIDENTFSDEEIEAVRTVIDFNYGNIGNISRLDAVRQLYFYHNPQFQVEIKSWVDEIGRARYHKRYLKKKFPQNPRPRYLSTTYKFFSYQGKLLRRTDKVFSSYLSKYYRKNDFDLIPWWDLLYWEYSWSALEGLSVTYEHRFAHEIFIPFNNRLLLEKMLSVPLAKRIEDRIQIDVISRLCPQIISCGVHVKDFGWNRKRELAERLYWEINTKLRV